MAGMARMAAAVLAVWLAAAPGAGAAEKWKRSKSNPLLRAEQLPAPEGAFYPVLADPHVLADGGLVRMWFGYGGLDRADDAESIAMRVGSAVSIDGGAWAMETVPALDLGDGWDGTNAEAPCVLKDAALPDGDPRKYRMYYAGKNQRPQQAEDADEALETGQTSGIGLAFSADGRQFTRLPAAESPYTEAGLILRPNRIDIEMPDQWDFIDIGDPFVVQAGGQYHMWYTSMGYVAGTEGLFQAIAYATSTDGVLWTKHGHVLAPELAWETGRPEASVGRPSVLWNGERFEMFYDAGKDDQNPGQNSSAGIGFAWSPDGKAWERLPEPVLTGKRGKAEARGMLTGVTAARTPEGYVVHYPAADPDWDHTVINMATGAVELPAEAQDGQE